MKKLLLISLLLIVISCTDASYQKYIGSINEEFKIEMYSGGTLVRTWTSTGKVTNEDNSDGYGFVDKATKKYVRVSGDLIITQID